MISLCHCFSSSQSALYFLKGQIQYMDQHGISTTLLIPDDGFILDIKREYECAEIVIIPIVRKIALLQDVICLLHLFRVFKEKKFDIIHLHTPKAGLLGSIAAKLLFHKRVVFHLHGLVSIKFNRLQKGLTYYMEKIPLMLSDQVISVSKSLTVFCIENSLVKKSKINTLLSGSINGIEAIDRFNCKVLVTEVEALKTKYELLNKPVFGFIGRLTEDKGIGDIFKIMSSLSLKFPNIILILVGPIEDEIYLEKLRVMSENFQILYFPRTDRPELYISLFDLLIFPSKREGFGLVAAEANALGKPVVAYDIVGIDDAVINNVTGTLVEPGNIAKLEAAVSAYLSNKKLLKEHGENGRKRILSEFIPEKIWEAQLEFYENLMQE